MINPIMAYFLEYAVLCSFALFFTLSILIYIKKKHVELFITLISSGVLLINGILIHLYPARESYDMNGDVISEKSYIFHPLTHAYIGNISLLIFSIALVIYGIRIINTPNEGTPPDSVPPPES